MLAGLVATTIIQTSFVFYSGLKNEKPAKRYFADVSGDLFIFETCIYSHNFVQFSFDKTDFYDELSDEEIEEVAESISIAGQMIVELFGDTAGTRDLAHGAFWKRSMQYGSRKGNDAAEAFSMNLLRLNRLDALQENLDGREVSLDLWANTYLRSCAQIHTQEMLPAILETTNQLVRAQSAGHF